MKKFQLAVAAALTLGSTALPFSAMAQVKHKTTKTIAAGVAGYELAKHSHNKFLKKHKLAAGMAAAYGAHKYMKSKDKKMAHGH